MDAFPSGRRPRSRPRTFASSPETAIDKIPNMYDIFENTATPTRRRPTSSGVMAHSQRRILDGMCPRPVFPACFRGHQPVARRVTDTIHPKKLTKHVIRSWQLGVTEDQRKSPTPPRAPGHRVVPTTPCGDSEAQEATVLARKDLSKASGQFEVQSAAAAEPPATGSPEPTSELKRPFDDTGLAGEASARLRPSREGTPLTVSANGDVSNDILTSEKGRHALGHAGRSSCFSAEQHENSTQNVKNVDFDGGNGLTAPSSNDNDDGIVPGDFGHDDDEQDHRHHDHLGHGSAPCCVECVQSSLIARSSPV